MLAYVRAQDAGRSEGFAAVHALVRSLTAVDADVLVQTRGLQEEKTLIMDYR